MAIKAEIAGLLEVEPFTGTTIEDLATRHCDLCGESGPDDGPFARWRSMYYDPIEALSVCEHCVAEYLLEKPKG